MPFSWRPTSLASATTCRVVSFACTRSKRAWPCVCTRACHSNSRTILHPRSYSRWQRLIILRKVHPPIIVGRRRHFGIVTDSSLLRYYYGQPALLFDWHVTRAFTPRCTRWYISMMKSKVPSLCCTDRVGRRSVACLSRSRHFWFSIELLGSLNTSNTSHSSCVGEENEIITSARLTEGRTPLLQLVHKDHSTKRI